MYVAMQLQSFNAAVTRQVVWASNFVRKITLPTCEGETTSGMLTLNSHVLITIASIVVMRHMPCVLMSSFVAQSATYTRSVRAPPAFIRVGLTGQIQIPCPYRMPAV